MPILRISSLVGEKKKSGGQAGAAVTYSDITMHVI